jgi:hypothetical protein
MVLYFAIVIDPCAYLAYFVDIIGLYCIYKLFWPRDDRLLGEKVEMGREFLEAFG